MHRRPLICACALVLAACQTNSGSSQDPSGTPSTQGQPQTVASPGSAANANATTPGTAPGTSAPATTAPANTAPTTAASSDANGVQYLGRVAAARPLLTWSGTGVAAAFTGTQAQLNFTSQAGTNYISLRVDGGPATKVAVSPNTPISTGKLTNGPHTLTAIKANEAALGSVMFTGMQVTGTATPAAAASRRIEFIGDSITVGYGVEGASPCTNSAAMENAEKTYAALTAAALGAQYDLIAWSGKGLTRNAASTAADTSPIMPTLWGQLTATDSNTPYDFPAARTPQAVVINLGTNDFTYIAYDSSGTAATVRAPLDASAYGSAYFNFIGKVRARYPAALILITSSPMLSDFYPTAAEAQHTTQVAALNAVVTQLGDPLVKVVNFPTETVAAGQNGCDSHPSASQHQDMATILTAEIKADLGW